MRYPMAGDLTAAWLPRRERVRLQAMRLLGQDGSLVRVVQRLSGYPQAGDTGGP
jgi:hypothetical protein